jgi:hypothetical protein
VVYRDTGLERFFEEACFNATRSDSEGKVHQISFFFYRCKLPFEFTEAVHQRILEGKKVFAVPVSGSGS